MGLDIEARGTLDKYFDNVISEIPDVVRQVSEKSMKSYLQIQSITDYVQGWAIGKIQGLFMEYFMSTYGRKHTEEEYREVTEVMFRRTADIRNKIFEAG